MSSPWPRWLGRRCKVGEVVGVFRGGDGRRNTFCLPSSRRRGRGAGSAPAPLTTTDRRVQHQAQRAKQTQQAAMARKKPDTRPCTVNCRPHPHVGGGGSGQLCALLSSAANSSRRPTRNTPVGDSAASSCPLGGAATGAEAVRKNANKFPNSEKASTTNQSGTVP